MTDFADLKRDWPVCADHASHGLARCECNPSTMTSGCWRSNHSACRGNVGTPKGNVNCTCLCHTTKDWSPGPSQEEVNDAIASILMAVQK